MNSEMAQLGESGKCFINEFFRNNVEISLFLTQAFIQPRDFEELVGSLAPEEGIKKVVLLDGHPRTGKTWTSVAAVAALIDRNGWQPDQWWTGGADSLTVCEQNTDLLDSARMVQTELGTRPNLKLVLLDDFIGTNSLRNFDSGLGRFLQWEEDNPWLRALDEGCTLIIVERSMFFTLAEIRLRMEIRGHQPRDKNIKVLRRSHGLFRRKEDGLLIGSFDDNLLGQIVKVNSTMHPLRDKGARWWNRWLVSNVPMVALSLWPKPELGGPKPELGGNESLWSQLDEEEKTAASWSLFGNDLESLADEVQKLEGLPEEADGPKLSDLAAAYLVLVAPALVFLGPAVHESLGLEEQWARRLQRKLYLSLAIEDQGSLISSGRVPNELYMWALVKHVEQNFPLLVRVCWYVVETWTPRISREKVLGLLMRGVLERALVSDAPSARLKQIFRETIWKEQMQKIVQAEALLSIEVSSEDESGEYQLPEGSRLTPGVAAAGGWLLYRFFHKNDALRNHMRLWFTDGIRASFDRWKTSASDEQEQIWDDLIGSFSPLLQWAIRASKEQRNPEELIKANQIRESLVNEIAEDRLRMILEDELIWGHIYTITDRDNRPKKSAEWADTAAKPLVEQTFQFLRDEASEPADTELGKIANRIFSLAWHNEWMPVAEADREEKIEAPGDRMFAEESKQYFDRYKSLAIEAIGKNPGILDHNLQYHWIHYVTQHAVWMRQWCFELDPDEYERRRGAPGSPDPVDNDDLSLILKLLLQEGPTRKRARNCLLLIGARAARLTDLPSLRGALDVAQQRSQPDEEVEKGLLQAVFELMRQGYLDRPRVPHILDEWLRDFTLERMKDRLDSAWADYRREVVRLSHPFDLLPPEEKGWEQLMPWHWRQG